MEFKYLEVTVKSAEDLKNLRHVSTMDVYVVVSLSGDESNPEQKTRVLQNCGTNPRWAQTFSFKVDEAAALAGRLTLKFEIKDDHNVRGHKDVGWVDVPVKELLEQGGGAGDRNPNVMRCGVRLPSGETKGVLEFSYKFGERFTVATPPEARNGPVIADPAAGGPPNATPRNRRTPSLGLMPMLMVTGMMADVSDTMGNVGNMMGDAWSNEAGNDGESNEA